MPDVTPRSLLAAVTARDGHVCAWHGPEGRSDVCRPGTLVPQHRSAGMGGSSDKHRLSNVVWLCSETNGLIESDPGMQVEAYLRGIKIRGDLDPTGAKVRHAVHGWCLLSDDEAAPVVLIEAKGW